MSQASGNPLLIALMQALRDAVQREMVATSERRLLDWPLVARRLHDEHDAISQAMRAGDGDQAARLMEAHIRRFYSSTST